MKNTIFNYFSCKNSTRDSASSSAKSCLSSEIKGSTTEHSFSYCKDEVILISSGEENDSVPSKKRKSLKVRKISSSSLPKRKSNAPFSQKQKKETLEEVLSNSGLTDESCDSLVQQNDATALITSSTPHELPYYLRNFRLAIDTVMNDACDAKLFEGEDARWIQSFYKLPIACQKLYTRLFHRKPAWLPINKISYKEIGVDLSSFLDFLVKAEFMECSVVNGKTSLSLSEILSLLPAPSLKNLAKSFHISILGSKEKVSTAILDMSKNQRTVLGSRNSSLEGAIIKRALNALGPCYKLEISPKKVFNRVLLVFDVTRGTEDDSEYSLTGSNQPPYFGKSRQLSTILLAEMGQMVYPTYKVCKNVQVFETRQELLEYETAYSLFNQVYSATENGEWQIALRLCKSADESCTSISETSKKRSKTLPHFMRGFSASAIYVRIKSLQVEILQRLRHYQQASDILRSLMKEEYFCQTRRGYWAERLALNLDQHLHDHVGAIEVIQSFLKDRYVRVGHVIALVERAQKLQSSGKVKDLNFYSILEKYDFSKAKEISIAGRLLPKRMQTGQARFMKVVEGRDEEDILLCSVEELALDHYKSEGYDQGIHGEGGTFTCYFSLLMWDIIFMDGIGDVFRTSYQIHPLDYNTDEFYENRREQINMRIELIKKWETNGFSVAETITEHWNKYEGVACTGMNWERFSSLQQALCLAECIGGDVLGGIIEVMAKDPRHTRSGLPDLVVWNTSSKSYKLVEVKGPGDRLSNNQKMWMHRLVQMGANVEVCHVTANASRRLGV